MLTRMALSQSDLDALDQAILNTELEVQVNGRRVKYRSTAELVEARAHVASVLAMQRRGGNTGVRRFNFTTSRGD